MIGFVDLNTAYDIGTLTDWYISSVTDDPPVWTDEHIEELFNDFYVIPKDTPVADVAPVKHGHIVWKEYYKGGIRRKKCLQEVNSIYIEQQMPCKNIAIIDERYLSKGPYCSECGKLLGEFLNYCGNCGAKMDGGDENV